MNVFRKLLLAIFALSFAFVIASCKNPNAVSSYKVQSSSYQLSEETIREEPTTNKKYERHHCRW